MITTVLLDLDGVLADFHGGAMRCFGKTIDDLPPGEVWLPKALGITDEEFWQVVNNPTFWSDLEPYPWVTDLPMAISSLGIKWFVATSPSRQPESCSQKVVWLKRHFGSQFHDYMIGWGKHMLARHDRCLIDDWDKNIGPFIAEGGKAILFPQRFNAKGAMDDPVQYVIKELRKLCSS